MFTFKLKIKSLIVCVGIVTGTVLVPQSSFAWDPVAAVIEAAGNSVGSAGEKLIDAYNANTRITDTDILNKATVKDTTVEVGGQKNYLDANLAGIDIEEGSNIQGSDIEVKSTIKRTKLSVRGSGNVVKTNIGGLRVK